MEESSGVAIFFLYALGDFETEGLPMAPIVTLTLLLLGTALACAAAKLPQRAVELEWCGGLLLTAGLGLLGASLPELAAVI